ncbi:MAG TPA: DMT family transporter [Gaiellaceae bacterium]
MAGGLTRRSALLFAAMCVIWGIPYLLIRVAVRDLSPSLLVLSRTALAALILLPLAAARGELRPIFRHWVPLLAFAAIEIAIPWVLLGAAEQRVSSSLTALLIAGVPLVGAVIAWTTGARERLGAVSAAGLGLGLVGVAAIVGLDVHGVGALALVEIGAVAVCYAVGPVILQRRLAHLPALGVIALALAATAVAYVPIAALDASSQWPRTSVVLSVVTLAVVCTAVAFVCFFALVADIGPVRATVITYVNPAVAAVLGVAILGERFTVGMGAGFVLVLAGSVLATRPARPTGPSSAEALEAVAS